MRKASLVFVGALVAAVAVGVAASPSRAAIPMSAGCSTINLPIYDSGFLYQAVVLPNPVAFAAGDTISFAATSATPPSNPAAYVSLSVDSVVVDTAVFPGTVEYTFATSGVHGVEWDVFFFGNASWTVSCTPGDPADAIADLKAHVADLGLAKGITTALSSKLDSALEGDDTATVCGSLNAFLNLVAAQAGKQLSNAQAADLTAEANAIRDAVGC